MVAAATAAEVQGADVAAVETEVVAAARAAAAVVALPVEEATAPCRTWPCTWHAVPHSAVTTPRRSCCGRWPCGRGAALA